MPQRTLVPLGEGAYTVAETCRILGASMTSRKVHYWLKTGLISGEPISRGRRGVPTILTFRQLLELRTVQHLRDVIGVSLPEVRSAFEWILHNLFEEREHIVFSRGPFGVLVAELRGGDEITVPGGQHLIPSAALTLTDSVSTTLKAWGDRVLRVDGHPFVVTSTRVLGGAPVVEGTRIDTSILAGFVDKERGWDFETVEEIRLSFPRLSVEQVSDALKFEGLRAAEVA